MLVLKTLTFMEKLCAQFLMLLCWRLWQKHEENQMDTERYWRYWDYHCLTCSACFANPSTTFTVVHWLSFLLQKRKCLFLEINNDRQEVGTTGTLLWFITSWITYLLILFNLKIFSVCCVLCDLLASSNNNITNDIQLKTLKNIEATIELDKGRQITLSSCIIFKNMNGNVFSHPKSVWPGKWKEKQIKWQKLWWLRERH